jgi:hypothetical protein
VSGRRYGIGTRTLGAIIGVAVCLCAAVVIHFVVAGDKTGLFAFPATIVTAIFVGVMGGLMFGSIIAGGRADDRATEAAHQALGREHEEDVRRPERNG